MKADRLPARRRVDSRNEPALSIGRAQVDHESENPAGGRERPDVQVDDRLRVRTERHFRIALTARGRQVEALVLQGQDGPVDREGQVVGGAAPRRSAGGFEGSSVGQDGAWGIGRIRRGAIEGDGWKGMGAGVQECGGHDERAGDAGHCALEITRWEVVRKRRRRLERQWLARDAGEVV